MPRYRYLLIALAVCAAAWSTYQLWPASTADTQNSTSPPLSEAEFTKLEKMAASACDCWMQGGDKAKCYQNYDKAAAKYAPSGVGTACAPVSTMLDCFGETSEQCIIIQYQIVAIEDDIGLCRSADAEAVEEAYKQAFKGIDMDNQDEVREADKAGRAAIAATLKRIRQGKSIALKSSSDGCV